MLEYYGCQATEDGGCILHFCYTENRRPYILSAKMSFEAMKLYSDAIEFALYDIDFQLGKLGMNHR